MIYETSFTVDGGSCHYSFHVETPAQAKDAIEQAEYLKEILHEGR